MSANINIYGYNFIDHDSKTCAGGVAFYINKSLKYVQSNKTSLNLENVEDLWIELTINEKPYLIGIKYRHPDNINLMQYTLNNSVRKYADYLLSCSTKCIINRPTRITGHAETLLDHIYVNREQITVIGGIARMKLASFAHFCLNTKNKRQNS